MAMFEAVITLCVTLADGPCRDMLLPGYEAASLIDCDQALADRAPALPQAGEPRGAPRCQPIGAALEVKEVAPGIFVHLGQIEEPSVANRGDISNPGFVIGGQSVAVIDSGTARWMGEALWRAVRAHTDKPISHVILTHTHPDHVFGASVFVDVGATVVGHRDLPRALADRQANYLESLQTLIAPEDALATEAPEVGMTVEDSAEIDIGDRVLELHAWPIAHTNSDLTVLDRKSGTLFAGDLLFDQHIPALDGSLRGWQAVLADLEEVAAPHVIPGHGGPILSWPDAAAPEAQYLDVLAKDTKTAIDAGERLGDAVPHIAQSEAGHWALFDAFNPRNATVAFTELEWE